MVQRYRGGDCPASGILKEDSVGLSSRLGQLVLGGNLSQGGDGYRSGSQRLSHSNAIQGGGVDLLEG